MVALPGFDPRCRPWYLVFDSGGTTTTQLTDMYIDAVTGNAVVSLSHPIYSAHALPLCILRGTKISMQNA